MAYAPLTRITLTNFMSFPTCTVEYATGSEEDTEFHPEGILNIKGFNDSGKSALLIATGVCLLNAYPRDQKSFIREGTDFFRVVCRFADGVSIIREKYADGRSLYEMVSESDGVLYTTRSGDMLTNVEGIPAPIEKYLGLFSDGSFYLNMRRRTDPMLLVNTSGSENFTMLNSVLKTAELSEAAKDASNQANVLANELSDKQVELSGVKNELKGIWETEEFLDALQFQSTNEDELTTSTASLSEACALGNAYVTSPQPVPAHVLDALPLIDSALLGVFPSALESVRTLHDTPHPLPLPQGISPRILATLESALESCSLLSAVEVFPTPLESYFASCSLNSDPYEDFRSLQQTALEYKELSEQYDKVSAIVRDLSEQLSTEMDSIRASGYVVGRCPSCSALVLTSLN